MKTLFCVSLVFSFLYAPAQFVEQTKEPTQFDRFITKDRVDWAAYITDTIRFPLVNFSELLRKRFESGEIRVSLPVTSRSNTANNIQYPGKEKVLAALPPDVYFDSLSNDLLEVVQILYSSNGKLYAYIPWVSPKYAVVTPGGIRLGFADYFSTAFNFKYNSALSAKSKSVALGQTRQKIAVDSIPSSKMLKSLYGKNIIESMWPGLSDETVDIFSIAGNRKLLMKDLNMALIQPPVSIPVFDSTGNQTGFEAVPQPQIKPNSFSHLELAEDWFYDPKKNLLFARIPFIILYARTYDTEGEASEPMPLLKLLFK